MKIVELGHERDEHGVVLHTLESVDTGRKCYRMIGGALVETDVGSTVPILKTKREKLGEALDKLRAELQRKGREFDDWKRENKIQVVQQ